MKIFNFELIFKVAKNPFEMLDLSHDIEDGLISVWASSQLFISYNWWQYLKHMLMASHVVGNC